jgi:hypothetical protein
VLPIRRAEELLTTLPGILSAKIVASDSGAVEEIHVLTTSEYTPKQTVRNIESALIAHLGMRVDHRKISVAASSPPPPLSPPVVAVGSVSATPGAAPISMPAAASPLPAPATPVGPVAVLESAVPQVPASGPKLADVVSSVAEPPVAGGSGAAPSEAARPVESAPKASANGPRMVRERVVASGAEFRELLREVDSTLAEVVSEDTARRRLYFEDIEVRRSRARGVMCRVTLRKGDTSYTGEAEGVEGARARVDLAARATLKAIGQAESSNRTLALDGVKLIEAFDREFVFVGVAAQEGRERALLTGTCEVKESPEQASVLAALDATNRWIAHGR